MGSLLGSGQATGLLSRLRVPKPRPCYWSHEKRSAATIACVMSVATAAAPTDTTFDLPVDACGEEHRDKRAKCIRDSDAAEPNMLLKSVRYLLRTRISMLHAHRLVLPRRSSSETPSKPPTLWLAGRNPEVKDRRGTDDGVVLITTASHATDRRQFLLSPLDALV